MNCFGIFKRSVFDKADHSYFVKTFSSPNSWDSTSLMSSSCSFADSSFFPQPQVEVPRTQPWTYLASLPDPMVLNTINALMAPECTYLAWISALNSQLESSFSPGHPYVTRKPLKL